MVEGMMLLSAVCCRVAVVLVMMSVWLQREEKECAMRLLDVLLGQVLR